MGKLQCLLLSERSQSEKATCCMSGTTGLPRKSKTIQMLTRSGVARGWEWEREGGKTGEAQGIFRAEKQFCMIL